MQANIADQCTRMTRLLHVTIDKVGSGGGPALYVWFLNTVAKITDYHFSVDHTVSRKASA